MRSQSATLNSGLLSNREAVKKVAASVCNFFYGAHFPGACKATRESFRMSAAPSSGMLRRYGGGLHLRDFVQEEAQPEKKNGARGSGGE
jgi:hypothetical protein